MPKPLSESSLPPPRGSRLVGSSSCRQHEGTKQVTQTRARLRNMPWVVVVVVVVVVEVVEVVVVVVQTWCSTRVSLHPGARVQLIKWVSASALTPSAGLTSREKSPTPVPSESRFQVSPVQTSPQPQGEEKDCEVRPPLPLLLRRKGEAIFSIASALSAQGLGPE